MDLIETSSTNLKTLVRGGDGSFRLQGCFNSILLGERGIRIGTQRAKSLKVVSRASFWPMPSSPDYNPEAPGHRPPLVKFPDPYLVNIKLFRMAALKRLKSWAFYQPY